MGTKEKGVLVSDSVLKRGCVSMRECVTVTG